MLTSNQLKIYRSLKQKKYRYKESKFLIEGKNLCEAALSSDFVIETILIGEQGKSDYLELQARAAAKEISCEIIPDRSIRSLVESVSPQRIAAVVQMPKRPLENVFHKHPGVILVLDRVKDPGNLGTIIRTAEWFGLETIVCSSECVDIFNSKVLRSSAGAYFYVPYVINNINLCDFLQELVRRNYSIWAAVPEADIPYYQINCSQPLALVFGSERHGLQDTVQQFLSGRLCIPGRGKTDSLNVAVAAAILLSRVFQKCS